MASPFEPLAVELIEQIIYYLSAQDVAALRLSCRDLDRKISNGTFTKNFKSTNVDLTKSCLKTFVELTQEGRLGTHLERCTISGIARNHELKQAEQEELIGLLTQAFRNLRQHSLRRALVALIIRVSPKPSDETKHLPRDLRPLVSWRLVWKAAALAYSMAMQGLEASGLTVENELNAFGSIKGCSLTTGSFFGVATSANFAQAFESIKRLNVSLSTPLQLYGLSNEELSSPSRLQRRFSMAALNGIARLLQTLPQIEDLEVSWYRVERVVKTATAVDLGEFGDFDKLEEPPRKSRLKSCTLRALSLTEKALSSFLEYTDPLHVTLADINVYAGTWTSIFRDIVRNCATYELDDLYEDRVLIFYIDVLGPSKFEPYGTRLGLSWIKTELMDSKPSRLLYRRAPHAPPESYGFHLWKVEKGKQYGPPYHVPYDLEKYNASVANPLTDDSHPIDD